jgi:hypothetical protein
MLNPGPRPGQATADPVLTREHAADLFRVTPRTIKLPELKCQNPAALPDARKPGRQSNA